MKDLNEIPKIDTVSETELQNHILEIYSQFSTMNYDEYAKYQNYYNLTDVYWTQDRIDLSLDGSDDNYGEFGYDPISPYTGQGYNDIAAMEDDDDDDWDCCGDPACGSCHPDDHEVDAELLKAIFDDLITEEFPEHVKVTVIIRDTLTDEDTIMTNDDLGAVQWALEKQK